MGTVGINAPKSPVTQGSSGVAVATLPNICKMPGPPAPFVPTPLPNIGKSDNSPQGYSTTVTIEGNAVAIKGATFNSIGDVASQGTGGGLISSNVQGPTSFIGPGSLDVQIEGKNVQLLGDPMLNNGGPSGSPANAATMGGIVQPPAVPPGPAGPDPTHKKVTSVEWDPNEAWCSDHVSIRGSTKDDLGVASFDVEIQEQGGSQKQSAKATGVGSAIAGLWTVTELLPPKQGDHLAAEIKLDASIQGVKSAKPLTLKFVTKLAQVTRASGNHHFDLSMEDGVVNLKSELKYVKGWGGQVVNLGAFGPGNNGVIAGLPWVGYRWMKTVGLGLKFWDGTAWQPLPAGFVPDDSNRFSVGFYEIYKPPLRGPAFACQYGNAEWPESFSDWSIVAPDKQLKITAWKSNIETTWTNKFALKRNECKSKEPKCCRHDVKVLVAFTAAASAPVGGLPGGTIIIADGNGRSNDSLFFVGEPRIAMAAHEFGHHIGNPDEYDGAAVDPTLNSDGAVKGIDKDSIMGQNLTNVKARHFRLVCQVLSDAVNSAFSRFYTYMAVKP